MQKLIRITTVPMSLEKLLEDQLTFMNQHYEVTAISADKERLAVFGKNNGVQTYHVEMTREITPLKDLDAVYKLYKFLKKEKPLIVHTHTPKAGIVGMLAAKMAGVPIRLHTVAGLPLLESTGAKRKVLNSVEKMTYACATKVYPNSLGLYNIILKEKFASQKKLEVLGKGSSNGIDLKYFDPAVFSAKDKIEIREKLNIPANDVVFIFIGRLVPDKGINELVQAFKAVHAKHPDATLLLVGPFEERLSPLKEENLREIQYHPKIFTTGYQQDVRPYLAISDILTFPSYREGFPNVVMQAGAMNVPSIVTDINGCNEIITENHNGLVIPVKDEKALEQGMLQLFKCREDRERMAGNSREAISNFYGRKEFWSVLLREYKKLESEIRKP